VTSPFGIEDTLNVGVGTALAEPLMIKTTFRVDRWDAEQVEWAQRKLGLVPSRTLSRSAFAQAGVKPYLTTVEHDCNLVTLAGWAALLGSVGGTSITNKFSATNGRIGIGTGSTAVAATDTALTGDTGGASTTSYYQLCGASPVITTASAPSTMVFTASFGNTVANFAWNEFGTDNYTASGVTTTGLGVNFLLFNHGLSAQGTKPSGQTWTATETFTCGFPSGAGTVS
jgi:hypothetical protein